MTLLLPVALLACAQPPPDRGGTAVGNPGTIGGLTDDIPDAIRLDRARLTPSELTLDDCEGGQESGALTEVDLLAADNALGVVPAGRWCGIAVGIERLLLEGETAGGTAFSVALTPPALALEGALTIDGDHLLLTVPIVLEADALEALGEDVAVPEEDPLAVAWAEDTTAGAWFWFDVDNDGLLSDGDVGLEEGPVSAGALASEDAESGCSAAGRRGAGVPAALLLSLMTLLVRRRGRPYVHSTAQGEGRHQT